jgi:uncharacterized membrane protein SirB2
MYYIRKHGIKIEFEIYTLIKLPNNKHSLNIVIEMFKTYIDTLVFNSGFDILKIFDIYLKYKTVNLIEMQITDFIIGYIDSELLMVEFNPQKYNNETVYEEIVSIIEKNK